MSSQKGKKIEKTTYISEEIWETFRYHSYYTYYVSVIVWQNCYV